MAQLQKKIGGDDEPAKQKSKISDDAAAKDAVARARETLKKADEAQNRKGGQWVICCGIKTWVPD